MTEVISKNIGKVPTYCGDYEKNHVGGIGYDKFNIVSYLGSCFISTVSGNKNDPCDTSIDSSGYLVSYSVNEGWKIVLNGLDNTITLGALLKETKETVSKMKEIAENIEDVIDTALATTPYSVKLELPETINPEEEHTANRS